MILTCMCVLNHYSHVLLFATPWTAAVQLLCTRDSPGKNTGVGCHSLLQGIFLTQGLNLDLLHCSQILYSLSHQGSPPDLYTFSFFPFLSQNVMLHGMLLQCKLANRISKQGHDIHRTAESLQLKCSFWRTLRF